MEQKKLKRMFRLLKADEIEVRVGFKNNKGYTLLLYKTARSDMELLDETVGPYNWYNRFTRDNKNCILYIKDPATGEWIGKEDTGTESNTEAEKGLASDARKRAGFAWGIGRELYTAPFIWVSGQVPAKLDAHVERIGYDESDRINDLLITDRSGNKIFELKRTIPKKPKAATDPALGFKDRNGRTVTCEKCSCIIESRDIAAYSFKHYNGHVFCRDCQKTEKK